MKHIKKGVSILLCALFLCSFGLIAFAEDHVHQYNKTVVPATCTDMGYTIYVCECGDSYKDAYVNPTGHHYEGWDVKSPATCTSEGLYERTCKDCDAVQTKTIHVREHYDGNKDGKCDTCGLEMEVENIYSPFDWFKDLFNVIFGKIKDFFALFSK